MNEFEYRSLPFIRIPRTTGCYERTQLAQAVRRDNEDLTQAEIPEGLIIHDVGEEARKMAKKFGLKIMTVGEILDETLPK